MSGEYKMMLRIIFKSGIQIYPWALCTDEEEALCLQERVLAHWAGLIDNGKERFELDLKGAYYIFRADEIVALGTSVYPYEGV